VKGGDKYLGKFSLVYLKNRERGLQTKVVSETHAKEIRAAARVLRGLGGEEPTSLAADLTLTQSHKTIHHEPKGCGEYERGQDKRNVRALALT
jgi:hypothetical protein